MHDHIILGARLVRYVDLVIVFVLLVDVEVSKCETRLEELGHVLELAD